MNVCASSVHKQLLLSFSSANILYFSLSLYFWMYKGNCSFFLTCVILVYPLAKRLFFWIILKFWVCPRNRSHTYS